MPIRSPYELTDPRQFFAEPATPRQRQYEALRAYFVERLASAEAARRFGYSPGAFRVLCHTFRRGGVAGLLHHRASGTSRTAQERAQKQIVALRKRNYSVSEISQALKEQGTPLSATAVREVLAAEGFAPSAAPVRRGASRPGRPQRAGRAVANVGDFTALAQPAKSFAISSTCPPMSPLHRPKSKCASIAAPIFLSCSHQIHRQTRRSPVVARPIPAPRPIAPQPSALAQFRSVEIQASPYISHFTASPLRAWDLGVRVAREPLR